MKTDNECVLQDWIPYKLAWVNNDLLVHWLYIASHQFTDPFFEDTIGKCMAHPYNSGSYKPVSSLESLVEWSEEIPEVDPVFIFHISRCGSTLLSQLLSIKKEHIVLAEVPLFDELLRLQYKAKHINGQFMEIVLRAAIKLIGKKRTDKHKRLFIKTDSWHIFFYEIFRRLYPSSSFILVYRSPGEVIHSHKKLPGMQSVPGIIEPQLFSFTEEEMIQFDLNGYIIKVLEKYLLAFRKVIEIDGNSLLLNHNQGVMAIINQIGKHIGVSWNATDLLLMKQRSLFHSKYPKENFSEKKTDDQIQGDIEPVMNAYMELEKIREDTTLRGSFLENKKEENASPL